MSKAFIAAVLQDSLDRTGVAATKAADDLVGVIVKQEGGFTLPSFGKFTIHKTKARKALLNTETDKQSLKAITAGKRAV
ncbi:hypothetical protein KSAC_27850 [Komagataeibacter saccharivorans]|uniref:HU family DNA-binding protein n=1 Tax=Komagataeibacter saccharivorans TaxID=265959 RepID=UPI0010C40B03|nr:HU family DNA-binding protein [Komagataeibacter saccharivorans]QBL94965.1 hypothetical protein KSAC_27850 [Komagataeibacter saccharivorans]